MTPDERASELVAVALQLAARVREDDPADVHRWLGSVIPDGEWMALAVVQACMTPVDRTWSELLEWVRWPDGAPKKKPPVPVRDHVDEVALERACRGEPVPLTRRERMVAVARLRADGLNGSEIGRRLGIHRRTVRKLEHPQPVEHGCEDVA